LDREQLPGAGHALELVFASIGEVQTCTDDELGDGAGRPHSRGLGPRRHSRRDVDSDPANILAASLHLAGVHTAADVETELTRGVPDRARALERPRRPIEGRKEAIARRLYLVASEAHELPTNDRVMAIEQVAPTSVAELAGHDG